MRSFGTELILDLHGCNVEKFSRENIEEFLDCLCKFIDMEKIAAHFWEYEGDPGLSEDEPLHSKGISVVQFIKTSSIVLHTVDEGAAVFLNIFSCKSFRWEITVHFVKDWFDGEITNNVFIMRP